MGPAYAVSRALESAQMGIRAAYAPARRAAAIDPMVAIRNA